MTNMNQVKCSSGSTKVACREEEGIGEAGTGRYKVSGVRVDAIPSRQPRQQGCKGNHNHMGS